MTKIKLIVFDMDGTLLEERGIFKIAENMGFYDKLTYLFKEKKFEFFEKSIEIAKLSKGFSEDQYLEIFRKIQYSKYVQEVINELKKKKILTAIATDSYTLLAEDLKKRLDINHSFANTLVSKKGKFTGELILHNKEYKKDFISGRIYSICKSCVLEDLCKDLNIGLDETIAVGDGIVDTSMIKKAGIGIAYNAPEYVQEHADIVTDDMSIILEYI
jgi:phosphoserine phosphatase